MGNLGLAEGLTPLAAASVALVLCVWLGFVFVEVRRSERAGATVLASALFAALCVAGALLRPTRVEKRGARLGPRVAVLVDQARRLRLPAEHGDRRSVALDAAGALLRRWTAAEVDVFGFAEGKLVPLSLDKESTLGQLGEESDLTGALSELAGEPGERFRSIVVVSDGRLARPTEHLDDVALSAALGSPGVPVHTVRVAEQAPADASVREVSTVGAAVAHQPLVLHVTVGCAGGLRCDEVPVVVRELRQASDAAELARGVAHPGAGEATIDLEVTIERAGQRVIEVAIDAPPGDRVPENDHRLLTLDVRRERVRLLHVAGRPTYDVRQLRLWLKGNESIDLVAFFILRTNADQPNVVDDTTELSLIPFPVDALFTQHLPTFDAVMLQDIDANEYKLEPYLPALEAYVRSGGGLIMVGGPSAFSGGGYAGSPLERVLPVELPRTGEPYDLRTFVPAYTAAGRVAPVLGGVRQLLGEELPAMEGSNSLGKARPGSIVLWEHPDRRVGDSPMPVLALGEMGDGRSIALGVDGTHELAFSELAERTSGRAYGALWDGLLGWLMRDPRYEAGRVSLERPCIAGEPTAFELVPPPGATGEVSLTIERLGLPVETALTRTLAQTGPSLHVDAGRLRAGGYSARMRVGAAPPTRLDFACEDGGRAYADSRPDPGRLERIARATGGKSVRPVDVGDLPLPDPTEIMVERRASALVPPWIWSLGAALALGAHWLLRRRAGLA
ncbi:MAG TPA: glutamine amidotransferase [Polyangiaceae bacterium]|nr:glutamine amidotransferase [Polyangiaceae bacterium]